MTILHSKYLILLWLLLATGSIAIIALLEWRELNATLREETDILQRVASQRADQHDAHLTNLSAVAIAGSSSRADLFLDVTATILRFYPRITAVDLLALTSSDPKISTRITFSTSIEKIILDAVHKTDGRLKMIPVPNADARYLLIKRSPNSDATRFGLALEIDANALLETQSKFWQKNSVQLALQVPDGPYLIGQKLSGKFAAQHILSSNSQPLILSTSFTPALTELLPAGRIAVSLLAMTAILAALSFIIKSMQRAKAAEQFARLSAQETRLAHATRINGLGEMASGLAHELTQPLTAILSQSQAGLRLLKSKINTEDIQSVLSENIGQARRASAILERLRNWSRPTSDKMVPTALNDAINGVRELMSAELRNKNIALKLNLNSENSIVLTDPVELEQVFFNLVSNAMQAIEDRNDNQGFITVTTQQNTHEIIIDITDTGLGVAKELQATLFDPFVTGRTDGTGLGLALSSRLIERMNGEIILLHSNETGACFRITLPHFSDTVNSRVSA